MKPRRTAILVGLILAALGVAVLQVAGEPDYRLGLVRDRYADAEGVTLTEAQEIAGGTGTSYGTSPVLTFWTTDSVTLTQTRREYLVVWSIDGVIVQVFYAAAPVGFTSLDQWPEVIWERLRGDR